MADSAPVDIVDRVPPRNLHGVTWTIRENAYLDELGRLYTERSFAYEELAQFAEAHPLLVDDDHFIRAVMALR